MPNLLEPDQSAELWDGHVPVYARVFEPFSLALAGEALRSMDARPGRSVLDVGAGPGGAAIALAREGADVTAVDLSAGMVAHARARSEDLGLRVSVRQMDALNLEFPDRSFDAALSILGIILVPDTARALREMGRVVRSGGTISVVTWTEPEHYELAVEIGAAIAEVWPDRPRLPLPAQLRFRARADFVRLFQDAGLPEPAIVTTEAELLAPTSAALIDQIDFAPGMKASLERLGERRERALSVLKRRLEERFGDGQVRLRGVAFTGSVAVP